VKRTLAEITRLIRSKNAGPFWLTIDIMFKDRTSYRCALEQDVVSASVVAALFGVPRESVLTFACDPALAIKTSFPRVVTSGSPLDSDLFGGQQYASIMDLVVDVHD
jgi:hypothetical protein